MDEARYSISELAGHSAELFETTPEMVTVALRLAGKDTATVDEAKAIVREFAEREVK